MTPRLLITGSRNWTNRRQMEEILADAWRNEFIRNSKAILVHGAARGADRLAADLWEAHGLPTEAHKAEWDLYGKRAGILRNKLMVELGANLCIAFLRPESIGAVHCAQIAEEAGIQTYRFMEQ